MLHLVEVLGEGAASGGSEAVFGTGDAGFEIFQAGNVIGLFEFAGMDAEIAVGGLEDAFQVFEAEAGVGGEGADDSETNALVNQAVEFGEFESGRGNALWQRNRGFRGLAAVRECSSHRASGQ